MDNCVFCDIVARKVPASIVFEDSLTLAFLDLRQFHAGHTLVIPKAHLADVRETDGEIAAALMMTLSSLTRAVSRAFPSEGFSIWHSIGPAANQEVPHLHFHIHPRKHGDNVLRVYPSTVPVPNRDALEEYASRIMLHL